VLSQGAIAGAAFLRTFGFGLLILAIVVDEFVFCAGAIMPALANAAVTTTANPRTKR